jgi:hypothetical protein
MRATVYCGGGGEGSTIKGESVMTVKGMASRHIRKKSENNRISGDSVQRKIKVERYRKYKRRLQKRCTVQFMELEHNRI